MACLTVSLSLLFKRWAHLLLLTWKSHVLFNLRNFFCRIEVTLLIGTIDNPFRDLPSDVLKFIEEPDESPSVNLSESVLEILESPYTKVLGAIDKVHPDRVNSYLRFVTSLECFPSSIAELEGDLKISRLPRLNHLKLLINPSESHPDILSDILEELKLWKNLGPGKNLELNLDSFPTDEDYADRLSYWINSLSHAGFKVKYHGDILLELQSDLLEIPVFIFKSINKRLTELLLLSPGGKYPSQELIQLVTSINCCRSTSDIFLETEELSTRKDSCKFTITNSCIRDLQILPTEEKFLFGGMSSLKTVYLKHATLAPECFNSLPDTVLELQLHFVTIRFTRSCPTKKLPLQLQRLELSFESLENLFTLDASNIDKLYDFQILYIHCHPSHTAVDEPLKTKSEPFFNQLPFSLRKLKICYLESESGSRPTQQLSMSANFVDHFELSNHKHHVTHIWAQNRLVVNFSNVSSTSFLDLSSAKTFSGQLSSTLESLNIDLECFRSSFDEFWKKFIEPSNLFSLSIRCKTGQSEIDVRKLVFPVNIHNIYIFPRDHFFDIKIGELPESLNYIQVYHHTFYNNEILNERRQSTDPVNFFNMIHFYFTLHVTDTFCVVILNLKKRKRKIITDLWHMWKARAEAPIDHES
ncbi:unnamed protein product [Ambrosiozyma monospora]|uniref:Unnamed protein product n=1 Tax=Ambrosiozyma monospora TaxID=43982 RepID=A0ACB5SVY3_AMBMO|nr:unnamed protein product [Ambrosiozyma monospora]